MPSIEQPIPSWLWIFAGGGLGSCCRYWLGRFVQESIGQPFWIGSTMPWGTISINIIGCFLIGLLAGLNNGHATLPTSLRFALITGFLGGFTTFSTFGYESFLLFGQHSPVKPLLNISISVVGGLSAVWLGFQFTKLLLPPR